MNADLQNWIPRLVRALVDVRSYKSVEPNLFALDKVSYGNGSGDQYDTGLAS